MGHSALKYPTHGLLRRVLAGFRVLFIEPHGPVCIFNIFWINFDILQLDNVKEISKFSQVSSGVNLHNPIKNLTYGLTAGPKNVEKFFMSIVCGTEIAGLRIV